jgi:hypothetical protein
MTLLIVPLSIEISLFQLIRQDNRFYSFALGVHSKTIDLMEINATD